ncbi:MAG: GxxExxY protein [Rhodospirillaceae bacterium]|nr:GxxExxY protein [Rhodospirillales bacterium]
MAEQAATLDILGRAIVDSVIKIHKALGPGLLESVYEHCLAHELRKRSIEVRQQVPFPVIYDGERIEGGLRLDLLVGDAVVVEVKAVEKPNPIHQAQLHTYLKLTGLRLGYLVNFIVRLAKDGIQRYAL